MSAVLPGTEEKARGGCHSLSGPFTLFPAPGPRRLSPVYPSPLHPSFVPALHSVIAKPCTIPAHSLSSPPLLPSPVEGGPAHLGEQDSQEEARHDGVVVREPDEHGAGAAPHVDDVMHAQALQGGAWLSTRRAAPVPTPATHPRPRQIPRPLRASVSHMQPEKLTLNHRVSTENESRSVVSNSLRPSGLPSSCPWGSPGHNTGVGSRPLFQGIFPTQGSNPSLPHCGLILYQLSYHGSLSTGSTVP